MSEEPETNIAPKEKGPTRNFWPFVAVLILACTLAYIWAKKDNAEKTLGVIKKDRSELLQTAETGNSDETSRTVPSLPTGKPVAVAVAKPAQPQPAQGQAAPVAPQKETAAPAMTAPPATQPLAVQSQPVVVAPNTAQPTLEERVGMVEKKVNALGTWATTVSPCLNNLCKGQELHSKHNPTSRAKPGKGKRRPANQPVKSYLPAGPSFSPQQQGDCRVPPGTDYPDRFMPAGPGCSGKTCTQYRQQ